MTLNFKNYLDFLNKDQLKAIKNTDGSCLILAGAGSGKTRVLAFKILHLLVEKKAFPNLLRGAAIRFLLTRINDQIYHQKDPLQIGLESLSKKIAILDQINIKNHNQIP